MKNETIPSSPAAVEEAMYVKIQALQTLKINQHATASAVARAEADVSAFEVDLKLAEQRVRDAHERLHARRKKLDRLADEVKAAEAEISELCRLETETAAAG
jgi:chromosome segregation ATPase